VKALGVDCISSVGDCDYGTVFDTGIVVEFDGIASEISDEDIQTIKDSFLESVNALYENTEETCNPVFCMIESVDATVVTNKTRRMMLQRTGRRVQEDEDLTTGPTNSLAPSLAPRSDSTSFPTASPSFAGLDQSESFSVLLYVSGVCNGCLSDLTLSNQVAVPRPAKPEERMP
jgi:hypothetical protein